MIHLKGIMNDIVTPESPESPESPDYNNSNMTNEYQISPDYLILNILAFSLLFYAFGGPIYNCIRKCKDQKFCSSWTRLQCFTRSNNKSK